MRRKATPDFWRPAWARRVAAVADGADAHHHARDIASFNWLAAVEQARDGDWAWLDDLVERVAGDGDEWELAPPPDTWAVLDDFFSAPPPRRKGLKRRKDQTVAEVIRYAFADLTTRPGVVVDDKGTVVGFKPPMTDDEARKYLASVYNVSEHTIRDIAERRKTYRGDR